MKSTFTIGITGATGNLGRRMLHYFAEQFSRDTHLQVRVKCLVRSVEKLPTPKNLTVIPVMGDLTHKESLIEFVQDLDVCIHLASLVGFGRVADYHQVNVLGTQALCEALSRYNSQCRLIHCSSIAVLRRNSFFTWLNTDYANSKFKADQVVNEYRRKGLEAHIIYPGLIYGPEDTHFIPTLAGYLRRQKVIFLTGGEKNCPAIYIDDLCALFYFVVRSNYMSGRDYIGVGPQELGIHQFINRLANLLEVPQPKIKLPKWLLVPVALCSELWYHLRQVPAFPTVSKRSIDLLSIHLPPQLVQDYNGNRWHASITANEGLDRALGWYRAKRLV
jgi:nucleoside-diphosphate-sugar epimerase